MYILNRFLKRMKNGIDIYIYVHKIKPYVSLSQEVLMCSSILGTAVNLTAHWQIFFDSELVIPC